MEQAHIFMLKGYKGIQDTEGTLVDPDPSQRIITQKGQQPLDNLQSVVQNTSSGSLGHSPPCSLSDCGVRPESGG